MNDIRCPARHLASLAALAWASFASAQYVFVEDFTTDTYKDAVNTTAFWDTTAGELKLQPLPVHVGGLATLVSATDLAIAGDLAFVLGTSQGFNTVDIGNPAAPVARGAYSTSPGDANGIAVAGDFAFIVSPYDGFIVLDVSDPWHPALVDGIMTPYAVDLAISGNLAVVYDFFEGLEIIDITSPQLPVLVGNFAGPGEGYGDVAVCGSRAYMVIEESGLQIVNLGDPANPVLLGSYDTPGLARSVTVSGALALVADGGAGIQILDISDPSNPSLVATYDTPGNARRVTVAGNLAYVADGTAGLLVLDITDPSSPVLAGSYETPGNALSVAVAGEMAYVADETGGLQVVRIARRMSPALVGACTTPGTRRDVAVAGDLAVVADGYSGLQAIDISDPGGPFVVSQFRGNILNAVAVALQWPFAFAVDYDMPYFQVFDLSDPANPALAGGAWAFGYSRDLTVDGNLAFLTAYTYPSGPSLRIFDITDPTNMVPVGAYGTLANGTNITVDGDHDLVFLSTAASGLEIIDIADPTNPTLVGNYNTPEAPAGVAVAGNYAFVPAGSSGLLVLDISDPANPTLVGSCGTIGVALDCAVAGDLIFVESSGLQVFDISNPTSPTLVESYAEGAGRIVLAGDHAFTTGSPGLQVIQVFQHEVADASLNIGQSVPVMPGFSPLFFRLTTIQTAGVSWQYKRNAGASWIPIDPGDSWNFLYIDDASPAWRSTHTWSPGLNPTVSELRIETLAPCPWINAVTDVANDQGRQVRVVWTQSSHDLSGSIAEYAVSRRIDPDLGGVPALPAESTLADLSPAARENALLMLAEGWDFLMTVPARAENHYAVVVPTLADSTIADGDYQTTFRVTALAATPGVVYHSLPDSGCSVDNLAPAMPGNISAWYQAAGVVLEWDDAEEPDFQYHRIYRGNSVDFVPGPENLVHQTAVSAWTDPTAIPWGFFYKTTTCDFSGNESAAGAPGSVSGVDDAELPLRTELYPAAPNPFNPTTTLSFAVPSAGPVRLRIYDVAGRLIRTLVDDVRPAGRYQEVWDGRSAEGRPVASGIYLYRLQAGGISMCRRMVILR
ncbi:MAG: FlgD immunoglobulin-like domain containing protein [bacterium]